MSHKPSPKLHKRAKVELAVFNHGRPVIVIIGVETTVIDRMRLANANSNKTCSPEAKLSPTMMRISRENSRMTRNTARPKTKDHLVAI